MHAILFTPIMFTGTFDTDGNITGVMVNGVEATIQSGANTDSIVLDQIPLKIGDTTYGTISGATLNYFNMPDRIQFNHDFNS